MKDLIRREVTNSSFYKVDKILRIKRIKVLNVVDMGDGTEKVTWKMGANMFNPITWIIILGIALYSLVDDLKDLVTMDTYTRTFQKKQ